MRFSVEQSPNVDSGKIDRLSHQVLHSRRSVWERDSVMPASRTSHGMIRVSALFFRDSRRSLVRFAFAPESAGLENSGLSNSQNWGFTTTNLRLPVPTLRRPLPNPVGPSIAPTFPPQSSQGELRASRALVRARFRGKTRGEDDGLRLFHRRAAAVLRMARSPWVVADSRP
jgi:hypothetical protein